MNFRRFGLLIIVCGLLCFFSRADASIHQDNYLLQLIQQAHQQKLSDTAQWHRLLHYRQRVLGRFESEADDPSFFAANDGKFSPQHELDETVRAFFSNAPWGQRDEPAQCAFIARFEWLNQQLHFDPAQMPNQDCPVFDKWFRGINPDSLTLVFPSSYLNNPSSMFGHTLLRVDSAGQNENTRLLAYAINYGADTGNDNGIAFAVKGIFGGYHGTVGIGPYYLKVKEYSDTESRDIWEYPLSVSHEQVRRLLAHVWELRGVYFDYYFFDENCSYFVLALLDVARPELDLSAQLHGWVIPSDTLRLVVQQPDLVKQVDFRPSAGTKLAYLATQLTAANQITALALANGDQNLADVMKSPSSTQDKADTILLARDYLRYEYLAHRREQNSSAILTQQLLQARSAIDDALPNPPVPTPNTSPDQGHATGMIQLGMGRAAGEDFAQLDLRPAYHDLLDNDEGYIAGAQIDFLRTSLRHYTAQIKTELNALTLLEIISLSPRNRLFSPVSWRIKAGWQRHILPDDDNALSFRLQGGAGLAMRPNQHSLVFTMLNLGIDRNHQFDDGYNTGYGLELGAVMQPRSNWKILLRAEQMQFSKGIDYRYTALQLGQRINLDNQHALDIQFEQQHALDVRTSSVTFAWRWYL